MVKAADINDNVEALDARSRIMLRIHAMETIEKCDGDLGNDQLLGKELGRLFGYSSFHKLAQAMFHNADLCRRVGLLGGANGVAIYKALKARQTHGDVGGSHELHT